MIELYPKGTQTFARNGIALHPSEATVTYTENGQYDLEMTVPITNDLPAIDWGMVIRCPVPKQVIGDISLGTVSYWTVTPAEGAKLYANIPTLKPVSYAQWMAYRNVKIYAIGDKVSYLKKNYRMIALDPGEIEGAYNHPPDNYPQYWTEIPGTTGQAGKVVATLAQGTAVMKTADFNAEWMEAATLDGKSGYIKKSECQATGETESRTIPGWTIYNQSFVITDIRKDESGGKSMRITAEHISYQLRRTMLGECNLADVSPATAVMFIVGAMKESYPGEIQTNLTGMAITGDFSWKNAQSAILDPKAGILQATGGVLIRDDFDVYLLAEGDAVPRYSVRYGKNMKSVRWTGNTANIVTRVYPIAQAEDGSTLMLPEEHIDTVRTVPFVQPEVLNTGLKIGQEIEDTDGTKITLDETEVYNRMRAAAQNRFAVDKCDMAQIKLELDWIHMPDTEEYAQYRDLDNAAPGDWVEVVSGPLGIRTTIRMTGYTWDPILMRYKGTTFGEQKAQSSIAGYQLGNGAVTARVLGAGSVGSGALMADSVTAREIAANSITADRIASRQITSELIEAGAITAYEIAANAITSEKITAGAILANHIASKTITADQIASGTITSVLIAADAVTADKIAAGAVSAGKIAAGAITAEKIGAGEVTAEKINAGAVTAEKIGAGAVTADKISAADLSAIQAKLQIADIASATIGSADISFAKVKDLNASSAYFGEAVIQSGLANKLYVPRLAVGYAQMIGATVGDLVIQASDGNFYGIDVDLDGNVTATLRNVSDAEIASGHTTDGRQLVLGTDILAEDLNTNNLTASHALMYSITANIIDVDQLWAREAFVNKLMVQDISSNTYIRSTIGNWQSGSTITQSIDTLFTRIADLGYGTVYMSPDEPDHSDLSSGDIWIQTMTDGSWQEIYDNFSSWNEIYSDVSSWQVLGSIPIMWVWDGQKWQQMYDALLPTRLETEIEQLNTAITLKASKDELDIVTGEVTEMRATLTVQAEEIESAVSTVNAKAASFVMWEDPRTLYTVSMGDIWIKRDVDGFNDTSTWQTVYDQFASWQALYNMHDSWGDMLGDRTYVWNGSAWVETSDRASQVYQATRIDQTAREISLVAETSAELSGTVYTLSAELSITAEQIRQEVQRASSAEANLIEKTVQYQTADQIVAEAIRQSVDETEGLYIAKTGIYQTPDAIVSEAVRQSASAAAGAYLAKTSTYQTADAIKNEAVRASGQYADETFLAKSSEYQTINDLLAEAQDMADGAATTAKNASIAKTSSYQSAQAIVNAAVASAATSAGQTYIAKTTTYQTADAIASSAQSYTDGKLTDYSTTEQTSTMISNYVRDNAYGIQSGITITAQGIDVSGSQYVKIASGGYFQVKTGNFGIDTNSSTYVLWSGASTAASSNFRLKKDGSLTVTKLMVLGENGTETEFDLRNGSLWKLNYQTVKQNTITTDSAGYCTSFTLSNGTKVNFKTAASSRNEGWTAAYNTVGNFEYDDDLISIAVPSINYGQGSSKSYDASWIRTAGYNAASPKAVTFVSRVGTQKVYNADVSRTDDTKVRMAVNCAMPFDDGMTAGASAVTLSAGGWRGGYNVVTASNSKTVTISVPAITLTPNPTFTDHKKLVVASGGDAPGPLATVEVDATSEYTDGQTAAGLSASWNGATLSVSRVAEGNTKSFSTTISGDWSSNTYQVKRDSTLLFGTTVTAAATLTYDSETHTYTATPTASAGNVVRHTGTEQVSGTEAYEDGQTAAGLSATWSGATLSVSRLKTGATKSFSTTIAGSWSSNTYQVKRDSTLLFGTTVTAAATLTYDSSTHTYTATPTASAGGAVRHTGTEKTSGTEAYKDGWNAARDDQTTIGTCYEITAHSGDWVKVRELGTGYSRVPLVS